MDGGRLVASFIGFLIAIPIYLWLFLRCLVRGPSVFTVKKRDRPPDCLLDPRYGIHKKILVNGLKLHYVEAGSEDKPLILFVHGFPEFWFVWRHQMEYFKQNYRVIALDNRGYGDSEKPLGIDNYHIKALVEDVKLLVEGVGVSKFTLVGHDWGGAICWTFAALYPEMLYELIICNCPHPISLRHERESSWRQKTTK